MPKKSIFIAYFLWAVGSALGLHLFYLKKTKRAKIYLLTTLGAWTTFVVLTGVSSTYVAVALFLCYFLLWLVMACNDAIKIPRWIGGESSRVKVQSGSITVPPPPSGSPTYYGSSYPRRSQVKISPSSSAATRQGDNSSSASSASDSSSATKNDSKPSIIVDRHLKELGRYVVVDVETTGLDEDDDRIIEIAAIKYEGRREIDRFVSFIRPYTVDLEMKFFPDQFVELKGSRAIKYLSEETTEITGITDEDLYDAPTEKEVIEKLDEFVGSLPVVGHNCERFDTKFIRKAFIRAKIESLYGYRQIDTFWLSHKVLGWQEGLHNRKLQTLGNWFGIPGGGVHRAEADAEFTAQVFYKLLELVGREGVGEYVKETPWYLRPGGFQPNLKADKDNEFYGKTIVPIGDFAVGTFEAYQMAADAGATLVKNMTLKVNGYVIIGALQNKRELVEDSNYKKAKKYAEDGRCDITFLSEEEFISKLRK